MPQPDPPPLETIQMADALYDRVVQRGRRLRRERRAFLATAGMSFVLLAAAVPVALVNDDGAQVATTNRPPSTRPTPTTTTTTAFDYRFTDDPGTATTLAPVPVVAGTTATTARRGAAPRATPTTRRSAPATTRAPSTSAPASPTTTPSTVVPPSPSPTACEGTAPSPAPPGGRGVAFVRGGDIWATGADGPRNLTNTAAVTEGAPAWSPDGSRVAFERDGGIFTMVASGVTPPSELTPPGSGDSDPAWSPDGGRIAFVRGGDVWVVAANSGTPDRAVGEDLADGLGSPTWSPNGCELAFTWRGGVVRSRTDGTGLANVRTNAVEPSWGPTGRLAVSALSGNTREVWLVNPDGGNFERLTIGGARGPSWSADGTAVAFAAPTRPNPGIYTQAAGGDPQRVTTEANDSNPAW